MSERWYSALSKGEIQPWPLEVVEFRAVREAAADVARNYGISEYRAIGIINKILARYGD
jgi:hypothetical protein